MVDLTGRVLLKAPVLNDKAGDFNVWGATSRELIVTLPHGGHGGRCAPLLVMPPTIAPADLEAPLEFLVNTPGDCLKLRTEPVGSEIKCLSHGTRLTATKGKQTVPPLWGEHALVAGERWLHVRTAAGGEGWVAFRADLLAWAS